MFEKSAHFSEYMFKFLDISVENLLRNEVLTCDSPLPFEYTLSYFLLGLVFQTTSLAGSHSDGVIVTRFLSHYLTPLWRQLKASDEVSRF